MTVDLNRYSKFVAGVTSKESMNYDFLHKRIEQLRNQESPVFNPALLLTASTGLGSESGEFQEIVKKVFFQGKPMDDETLFHAKRELGDIIWYWTNACTALGLDPNEVIEENVNKLQSRYPGGQFDVHHSEHRQPGDL
jgi:NTP pyrophosphatase (non-canonical NTP hydrolase)